MSTETLTRPLRILIVENHADTLKSLKLYLEEMGHQVLTAMTIHEGESVLFGSDCNVLLCDIGLPDGSGWQLAEQIKKTNRRIFTIAMSGFGAGADTERSLNAGFRRHLLKPFKPSELDKTLTEATTENF